MIKQRIIPKFLLRDGRLVKAVRFHDNFREAGNPVSTARVYNSYGVDELMFLDIQASISSQQTMVQTIERVSQELFIPLTAGGGVRSLDDVNRLLRAGADKVSINTHAVRQPELVRQAAQAFGDQCITVCIDYKEVAPGVRRVFIRGGLEETELEPLEWARRVQDLNCGEIVLCSIDRDGTLAGYDCDFVRQALQRIDVPVIASSGAGSLQHCIEALKTGVSGITIGSLFFFTDHSPIRIRSHLWSHGMNVRASRNSRN